MSNSNAREITLYQSFIAKSRYARFLDSEGRRESWGETVDRYFSFMEKSLKERNGYTIPSDLRADLHAAFLSREVVPSMRAVMTAGPALERTHVAAYNCSFIPIDDPKAFDEAMYVLLCGTGVGFSAEAKYVNKLPEVPDKLFESDTTLVVPDSKEGWAKSLRMLIALLYSGEIPIIDYSKIRPAGERLKTFGGRASGPKPLMDLFRFVIAKFKKAVGRKLHTIEAHDIMCKIGQVVVVGGVRRSALISLSDLGDDKIAHSKVGEWWATHPHRALANNSAVYEEKPPIGAFMREWYTLYSSRSGERGIFNRQASARQAARNGRRVTEGIEFGTNPCLRGDTMILTSEGLRRVDQLIGKAFTAVVDGAEHPSTDRGFWKTGTLPTKTIELSNGCVVEATGNHKFLTTNGWKEVDELDESSVVILGDNSDYSWNAGAEGEFDEGYVMGQLIGDGTFDKGGPILALWVDDAYTNPIEYGPYARIDAFSETFNQRSDFKGFVECPANSGDGYRKFVMKCTSIRGIAEKYGVAALEKSVPETGSYDFSRGLLRGFFDSDGSVQGSQSKGVSVRLGQSNLDRLRSVQRLLLAMGIASKIYFRGDATQKLLPDGRGGHKEYMCKAKYELVIANESLFKFSNIVGFDDNAKRARLDEALSMYKRRPNSDTFAARVVSITDAGIHDVYDCTIPDVHRFSANGLVSHNCSEIILRPYQFCNLSSVVVLETDTIEDLERKIRLATAFGSFQATLTNFPYLRKIWKKNTEEEALLGVSMTGILDNALLNDPEDPELPARLQRLRDAAVEVNKTIAAELGINQSVAVTAIKPEGTVSQLCGVSSGLHPQHSKYYIRRVRGDNKDPLTQFMKSAGFDAEPCVMNSDSTTVFSFPMKAPENALVRSDLDAIKHLKLWMVYQKHYCEHKPSVTITVGDEEWIKVSDFVYDNFDEFTGVSFLPDCGGSYQQMPFEEITKAEYEKMLEKQPVGIDWNSFKEKTDNVEGVQNLACTAGGCEL